MKGIRRQSVALRPINPPVGLTTDLTAIYAPAWQVWRDYRDRILATYTPAPLTDGDTLVRDTASDTAAVMAQAESDFLTRLILSITPALKRWIVRAEQVHRSRWSAAVKAGLGIDLDTVLTASGTEETLAAFLERNVALVRNISDQAQGKISDAVFRGYQNRLPAREVAKEIDEAVGFGRKRALNVAADQSSKLSGALDDERMAESGIALWKYRHSGKLHPRSWHRARDGRIYTLAGNKQVNADGSSMAGGDVIAPGDAPSQPPWCGCRKQAYLTIMAELDA